MSNAVIVWLEDRKDTALQHIAQLERLSIPFKPIGTPLGFKTHIETTWPNGVNEVRAPLFVIDLMLHGIPDLEDLEIENAPTMKGSNAGFVFADRFLRAPGSPWMACPICFLTEREITKQLLDDIAQLRMRGGAEIRVISKYSQREVETFIQFVESCLGP